MSAPTLSSGAVARQLGVSPATLRTWARRYGLEPSARSEGAHRRYTIEDVAKLADMQRLVRSGVPVADAAQQVLSSTSEVAEYVGADASPSPATARRLWESARALDSATCTEVIKSCVNSSGVIPTWEDVLRPVLLKAGDFWARSGQGVEVEHVLSDAVTSGLQIDAEGAQRSGVLLATTPEEDHVLPLMALRAALTERGICADLLTARTPLDALSSAVSRLRPAVILVWSQLPGSADPETFTVLPAVRPKPALAAMGPGWAHVLAELPADVTHLNGLSESVDFVVDRVMAIV